MNNRRMIAAAMGSLLLVGLASGNAMAGPRCQEKCRVV